MFPDDPKYFRSGTEKIFWISGVVQGVSPCVHFLSREFKFHTIFFNLTKQDFSPFGEQKKGLGGELCEPINFSRNRISHYRSFLFPNY